jgi:hypothetical protein
MAKREMHKDDQPKDDDEKIEGVETEVRPDGGERQQSFSNPLPSSHFSSPAGIPEVPEGDPFDSESFENDDEECDSDDDSDEKDDEDESGEDEKKAPAKKSRARKSWDKRA